MNLWPLRLGEKVERSRISSRKGARLETERPGGSHHLRDDLRQRMLGLFRFLQTLKGMMTRSVGTRWL